MPFKSKSQIRYLFARNPKVAREFAEKTKNASRLPEEAKQEKSQKRGKK